MMHSISDGRMIRPSKTGEVSQREDLTHLTHRAPFGKLYNRPLVSTQLDAAAHHLALTISSRGYEQPPNP